MERFQNPKLNFILMAIVVDKDALNWRKKISHKLQCLRAVSYLRTENFPIQEQGMTWQRIRGSISLKKHVTHRWLVIAIFVWPWNKNARTKQKQQTNGNHGTIWLVCRRDTNAFGFCLVIKRTLRLKKLHAQELSRNPSILGFDVILQHDWPIEQCLLYIRVFFGGKTKSPCFDLFIHWLIKQITKTYTETTFQAHTKIALPRVSTPERSHLFLTQSEQEKFPSVSELANRLAQLTNKAGFKHDWKCYLFKRDGVFLKHLRVINSQISTCRWGLRCWILKWQTTTCFNVALTILLKRHCNWISEKRTFLGPENMSTLEWEVSRLGPWRSLQLSTEGIHLRKVPACGSHLRVCCRRRLLAELWVC